MASGKKIGLFWGATGFSVIESNQDNPVKTFRVPFNTPADFQSTRTQADDLRLVSVLKDALKANKVTLPEVSLALPSKDIVIRSFIIPFLKPSEIKGVVEFEIKKYIPFNLKELSYSFHASPLIEDKVKRMRVHFVAIRREILEYYSAILKQAGLNVVFSEPAPMCLIRALIAKKHVKPDQKVAVVQTDFHDSRIIVFDGGIVQFVRDFQLHNPALNTPMPEPEMLKKKLFNEIKISLDFYMRQFKSEKISELLTISVEQQPDLVAQLQQELEMPVRKVELQAVVNVANNQDIGILNAYGAVLTPPLKTAFFNLSGSAVAAKQMSLPSAVQIPEEYLPAVKTGIICVVLLIAVFALTKFNVAQTKKKYDLLVDEQGPFLDMTVDSIKQKIADNTSKLETVKNIFRKTETAFSLVHLSKMLPQGVWLTDMAMQYTDAAPASTTGKVSDPSSKAATAMSLDLSGYAYSKDANEQFRIVYSVVNVLKSDDLFKKYLKSVNLTSIQSEQRDKDNVTSFKISAK
jgi:Tfp pilus assembly PilM family ATPase